MKLQSITTRDSKVQSQRGNVGSFNQNVGSIAACEVKKINSVLLYSLIINCTFVSYLIIFKKLTLSGEVRFSIREC